MSANFLNKLFVKQEKTAQKHPGKYWLLALAAVLWTLLGFGVAQALVGGVMYGLSKAGVPFADVNQTVFTAIVAVIVYILTLVILIGAPWWIRGYRTTLSEMGLTRLMSWGDIGLAPLGFLVYLIISSMLVFITGRLFSGIDLTQTQDTGFGDITLYYQYLLVFITLVIVAPLAEETIFRGYLYGKLRRYIPMWAAVLITSLVFGLVHGQWNVAIDVFALSIILCSLREVTGSIWAGVLLHMIKNGVAFFVLFIYPVLSHTIGG